MQADFANDPFVGVPILTENQGGNPPLNSDLDVWANTHSLSGPVPVLADPGWAVFENFFAPTENSGALLIGPDMRIAIKRTTYQAVITDAEVRALFP